MDRLIKFLLSFTKRDWKFQDYPIKKWRNKNAQDAGIAYGAGIQDWFAMIGHGATPDEALQNLKENFESRKGSDSTLPRPGTKVPIRFASTEMIAPYTDVARDFLKRIYNLDYDQGFYSDGSALVYFEPTEGSPEQCRVSTIERVLEVYSVDISDLYDEPLWKILKRISETT